MEIICFKIKGKLAHFRKYYANNTAFSFSIPPRTSIMGILASSIGWGRDSYYEKLSSDHINLGIRVLSPLKKSFHRLNYLSIKNLGDFSKDYSSDFRGKGGRIQTPFEIVSGFDISKDEVIYQIFIKAKNSGKETFNVLKEHFGTNYNYYNLSFGTANFSATIFDVEFLNEDNIKQISTEDFVFINSAIPSENIIDLEFEKDEYDNYNFVEEDMLPGDFTGNYNREVKKMNRLIFSITKNPLRVKLRNHFYNIETKEENINIQFMD